jgi:hypothetical protein
MPDTGASRKRQIRGNRIRGILSLLMTRRLATAARTISCNSTGAAVLIVRGAQAAWRNRFRFVRDSSRRFAGSAGGTQFALTLIAPETGNRVPWAINADFSHPVAAAPPGCRGRDRRPGRIVTSLRPGGANKANKVPMIAAERRGSGRGSCRAAPVFSRSSIRLRGGEKAASAREGVLKQQ